MANSKQKSNNNASIDASQKKIDEIKLKVHANAVRDNKNVDFTEEFAARANDVRQAIKNTVQWAKKNKIDVKTKTFLEDLTDMVAFFIKDVTNSGRE